MALQTITPECVQDRCCVRPLNKDLGTGKLDKLQSWICAKCGTEWRPRMIEGLNVWEPHERFAIFR